MAYGLYRIHMLPLSCVGGDGEGCGGITPWLWGGLAGVAIGLVIVVLKSGNKRRIGVVALMLVAFGMAFYGVQWLRSPGAPGRLSENEAPAAKSQAAKDDQAATSTTGQEKTATGARHPFPELPRSRAGLPMEDDPFTATTVAEQQWLDRHGYPTLQLWIALQGASDLQLEQAAQAGDRSAKAILSQRRLMAGEADAADDLLEQGALGNTFALELLSSTYAGPLNDPFAGYVMSRVVELRGNVRAGFARDVMFNEPLAPAQRAEAEQEAAQIFQQLIKVQKKLRGTNVPSVDPRPIDGELSG